MRRALAIVGTFGAVLACNSIVGFGDLKEVNAVASSADAGGSNGDSGKTSTDAGAKGPLPCDVTKPFGTPIPLAGPVNAGSAHQITATLTDDELTIIIGRVLTASESEIVMATRASFDDDFGTPGPVPGIAGTNADDSPAITGDGLTLYWAQELDAPDGNGGTAITSSTIVTAHRTSPTEDFSAPVEILHDAAHLHLSPYVTRDGTELYFTSAIVNSDNQIWRSIRSNASGQFETAAAVDELAAPTTNAGGAFMPNGLEMYFSSDRGGLDSDDIFTTTRASTEAPWANITVVPALNSAGSDRPNWISPDGCRLYMGSDRSTDGSIYIATRPPP